MYWYIKYPLIVILCLCLLGIGGMLWRSCVRSLPKPVPTPSELEKDPSLANNGGAVSAPETVTAIPEQPPVPPPPAFSPELATQLEKARQQIDRGMLESARRIVQVAMKSPQIVEFDNDWRKCADLINEINRRLMNSTAPCSEKRGYRVVKGDSLARIASRHYTSVGALLRINEGLRRDDSRDPIIRPSQTLMYISGVWSIRVSKQHFLLMLYLNGDLYRVFTVGIGRDNRTPAGQFLITGLLSEPAWTPPGKNIPYGDPENVLGTRWLCLTPTNGTDETLQGYGIHGTWEPDSVGTSCSAGCVRMRNQDVEELYDFIPIPGGTTPPVKVSIEE